MKSRSAVAMALALLLAACGGAAEGPRLPAGPVGSPPPTAMATPAPQVEAGAAVGQPTSVPVPGQAQVVYVGPRNVRAVALTFDTGVGPGHTAEILDTLKKYGKKATFGVTGEWAVTNPALLKRMVEEGHALINHSWSHHSFTGEDTETPPLSADEIRDELTRTEAKVQEIAGVSTKPYYRPPYGDYNASVDSVAFEAGYQYNVLWTVDGMGWAGRPASWLERTTLASAYPGFIFLYHVENGQEYRALDKIIVGLDAAGLNIVTIPQLLGHQPMPPWAPLPVPAPAEAPLPATSAPPDAVPTPPPPPPDPTPIPIPIPIPSPIPVCPALAFDDFESGSGGGGCGWLGPWTPSGSFVASGWNPHGGQWQLDRSASGIVYRAANLAGQQNVHLRFWARSSSLEASDRALVQVSVDGIQWQVVREFTPADSDGQYHLYDIDLSALAMSETFYVAFYSVLDPADDQWHIDDVELAAMSPP